MINSRRHTGFRGDNSVRIEAGDEARMQRLRVLSQTPVRIREPSGDTPTAPTSSRGIEKVRSTVPPPEISTALIVCACPEDVLIFFPLAISLSQAVLSQLQGYH